MSWVDTFGKNDGNSFSKEDYVQLKDGQFIEGVFMGDPYCFFTIFKEKPYKEYPTKVEGSSFKFKLNFIPVGASSAKIVSGGYGFITAIKDAILEYGEQNIFKIKRTGVEKNTTYSVFVKKELTNNEWKALQSIELKQLGPAKAANSAKKEEEPPLPTQEPKFDSEIPF